MTFTSSSPVICIPRISSNVTKHQLFDIFTRLKWGNIDNIYFVNTSKKNNSKIRTSCVFIYLTWNNNEDAYSIQKKLINGQSIKIVFNEFTIWKLYAKK